MNSRLIALFLLPFVIACGGDKEPEKTPEDAHDHSAKHGGEMVTLGDHEGHIEMKLDHDAMTITIWLSDPSRKDLSADEAPVLNFTSMGDPVSVTGKGGGAKWVFSHADFSSEPENGKFKLKVGGRTYTPKLAHSHH